MPDTGTEKIQRLLLMQERLLDGKVLHKTDCADKFHVTAKNVQRDLETLRLFFAERKDGWEIVCDQQARGYRLTRCASRTLTSSEVLAVCKILLDSRSMVKEEMFPILDKLVQNGAPAAQLKQVETLIANERFHYIEPHHGQKFIQSLWDLGVAIQQHRVIKITYMWMNGRNTVRTLEPVGILFSEYYFYLAAYIQGINKSRFADPQDAGPTIYRIDRIVDQRMTDTHFPVIYANRFQEGEMRKRIQFMYGGPLVKIRFAYTGPNLESILDKLPTARQTGQDPEGHPILEAEVYDGQGFQMWLRSQGEWIQRIEKF